MNKGNRILAVVLIIQIVLLGVVALWPHSKTQASGKTLFSTFAPEKVTKMQITDGDTQNTVTLQKNSDGQWILPDYGNYPVEATRVSTLLNKIKGLNTDRLITRSETSHRRLKVADDQYERLVEMDMTDGSSQKLYIGNTGSGSTSYVRSGDSNLVYMIDGLSSMDASALPSGWVNTYYFSVSPDQVSGFTLQNANGTFDFSKPDGTTWTMAGLADGETLNQDGFNSLLNQISTLQLVAPIGTEAQDSFGLDSPRATITVHVLEPKQTTGTPDPTATPEMVQTDYTILIGAEQDKGVVIKSSASDYYVLLSTDKADALINETRDSLVTVPPAATETPEPVSTPQPNQ